MAFNSEPEKAQSCLSLALTYSEVNTRYLSQSPSLFTLKSSLRKARSLSLSLKKSNILTRFWSPEASKQIEICYSPPKNCFWICLIIIIFLFNLMNYLCLRTFICNWDALERFDKYRLRPFALKPLEVLLEKLMSLWLMFLMMCGMSGSDRRFA